MSWMDNALVGVVAGGVVAAVNQTIDHWRHGRLELRRDEKERIARDRTVDVRIMAAMRERISDDLIEAHHQHDFGTSWSYELEKPFREYATTADYQSSRFTSDAQLEQLRSAFAAAVRIWLEGVDEHTTLDGLRVRPNNREYAEWLPGEDAAERRAQWTEAREAMNASSFALVKAWYALQARGRVLIPEAFVPSVGPES